MGRYILRAVNFDGRREGLERGRDSPASMTECDCTRKRPNLENGGIRLPFTEDVMCSFSPPRTFSANNPVTLDDARNGTLSDLTEIIMKLHVNLGRASDRQLKGVLVDSEGGNFHVLQDVDEVLGRCGVCRAFGRAPHLLIAGTSTVLMLNGKLQVALLFLGDIIALHAMEVFPSIRFYRRCAPKTLKKFGKPLRTFGSGFPGHRNVLRWMQRANGEMLFGAKNEDPSSRGGCAPLDS